MKKKILALSKETVAALNSENMSEIKGGRPTIIKTTIDGNICSPNSMEADCPSQAICFTKYCGDTGGNTTVNTSRQISCQGYMC